MSKKGKTTIDLDAILDQAVKAEQLEIKKPVPEVEPSSLKNRIVTDDYKPWLAASANVPKELRDKWNKMVKSDTETEPVSKFQPSYAYRSWEHSNISAKNGLNKALQELVKKSAQSSRLDEAKLAKLLTIVNPVTDSERGVLLQKSFAKQIINDLSFEIKRDPNYTESKYPHLSSVLSQSS